MTWTTAPSSFPGAEWGVETFFVISGFLITGILLDNKSGISNSQTLKQFYIRRFLRIFPLYYLVIILGLVFGTEGLRESWYWHVSYLSNIYFYLTGWHGHLSHFWSLAVEEQFYLFWPLLIMCLAKRILMPAIIAMVAAAPLYSVYMNFAHPAVAPGINSHLLMPSCLSALGVGALIACVIRNQISVGSFKQWLLAFGLAAVAVWYACGWSSCFDSFERLAEDCMLGWVVCSAAEGFTGLTGWVLTSGPISYLGEISYGFYILHGYADSLCNGSINLLGHPAWLAKLYDIPVLRILLFISISIGLASLSWYIFEKPINSLKRKFPYRTACANVQAVKP